MDYIKLIVAEECNRFIQEVLGESILCGWQKTTVNDVEVFYAYNYQPQSKQETKSGTRVDPIQRLVWTFKNDSDDFTPEQYQKALRHVEKRLMELLHLLGVSRNTVLVCVPTSSSENYFNRWKRFSTDICEQTGMVNGYAHVHIKDSSVPSHWGGGVNDSVSFDKAFFKGKDVILFDDLVTTGYTMKTTSQALKSAGANIIAHVALARSVQD